jgi:hypothetical protein
MLKRQMVESRQKFRNREYTPAAPTASAQVEFSDAVKKSKRPNCYRKSNGTMQQRQEHYTAGNRSRKTGVNTMQLQTTMDESSKNCSSYSNSKC